MFQEKHKPMMEIEAGETGWTGLYRAAGVGALIAVVFVLLDIALSFSGGDAPVGSMTAIEWFAYFQNNPFLGLRNLGLFNVINPILTIPLYLALFHTHQKGQPAAAALALILFLLGAATYIANNQALSMLVLSQQYAAATTDAQRALLASAGSVLLIQAEDFTPGTFVMFFLSTIGGLFMMAVIARGRVLRRWIGLTGLVGTSGLLIFTITATFLPVAFDQAMILALLGGLLMLAWHIAIALEMFRLGRLSWKKGETAVAHSRLDTSKKGMRA